MVDDDAKAVILVKVYLQREGYEVFGAHTGTEALAVADRVKPDLIVLDLMLPEIDGMEVCRRLREQTDIPVIMLTARVSDQDKLVGLTSGADDYVTKPFNPRELVARVGVVLRRAGRQVPKSTVLQLGDLRLDVERHEAFVRKEPLELTPTEFSLLEALMREPGRVMSREQLIQRVLGPDYEGVTRTIDVHVTNLRQKIGRAGGLNPIKTVYGVGYKIDAER